MKVQIIIESLEEDTPQTILTVVCDAIEIAQEREVKKATPESPLRPGTLKTTIIGFTKEPQ